MAFVEPFDPHFEVLDFETIEEPWNEYDLSDGSVLRGRLVVLRISRKDKTSPMNIAPQNLFMIKGAVHERGSPSPLTPDEISGKVPVQKTPVKILHSDEKWNTYRILKGDQILKTRMLVTDIFRVPHRYDQHGEPAYIISSGIIAGPGQQGNSSQIIP